MVRNVLLKVATRSDFERCGGSRTFSRARSTAFLDRADEENKRTSRVSWLAVYWTEAPITKWEISRSVKNS